MEMEEEILVTVCNLLEVRYQSRFIRTKALDLLEPLASRLRHLEFSSSVIRPSLPFRVSTPTII